MAENQNPKELNNPELTINPNTASTSAPQEGSDATTAIQNDLDDLINSTINDSAAKQKIDFTANKSDTAKKDDKKKALLRERKMPTYIIIFSLICVLFLSCISLGFLFYKYIDYQKTWVVSATREPYMPWVDEQYDYIVRTLQLEPLDKYNAQQVVTTNTNKDNIINRIIQDPEIGFITKKKILTPGVSLLYRDIANRFDNFEWLKNVAGQQWFFPNWIQAISKQDWFNNSIQKAIVSVESIRFAVALKYFSLLDSFTTQLSSYASMPKDVVAKKLKNFVDRGEKDIYLYVSSCYLNGYEIWTSCSTIGDFFNYYTYVDSSFTNDDKRLFLLTMDIIQAKLENTDFPSLDVSVRNIDTINNSINLNIEINTFKEDEAALTLDNGILNPHIYLITSIVNHLRESRYVLTDSININSLVVEKRKVKVWWQMVTVNTSSFSFALPLQNDVQREIYDFTNSNWDSDIGGWADIKSIAPILTNPTQTTTGTTTTGSNTTGSNTTTWTTSTGTRTNQ